MSIVLTDAAKTHVASFLAQSPDAIGLRVGVHKTGCSGWAYLVDLANELQDNDQVFIDQGIKLIVDEQALELIDGTEIDFVTEGLNKTFAFNNPKVTDLCGCGESFTINS